MGSTRRKRQRTGDTTSEVSSGAGGRAGAARVQLRRSVETVTVKEALSAAFACLDSIAHDAHVYHVQQPQQQVAPASRGGPTGWQTDEDLKAELFAAMAAPHYETLRVCIVSCGLQLLPVLDGFVRRVGLALATPILSVSLEAWELAALLCQYFRAGAVRLVEQLIEVLLRESGVFLLDAPCFVPTSLAERVVRPQSSTSTASPAAVAVESGTAGGGGAMVHARRVWLAKIERKWRLLSAMLQAVGPLVPHALLHRLALRLATELVDQGLLACTAQGEYLLSRATMAASSESVRLAAEPTTRSAAGFSADVAATTALDTWTLPLEWAGACVRMVEVLLRVANPVVPQLLASADGLVAALTASLHAGGLAAMVDGGAMLPADVAMPCASLYAPLVEATIELQGTLRLLRNPLVLPICVPPTITAERPKRRVLLAPTPVVVETSALPDDLAATQVVNTAPTTHASATTTSRPSVIVPQPLPLPLPNSARPTNTPSVGRAVSGSSTGVSMATPMSSIKITNANAAAAPVPVRVTPQVREVSRGEDDEDSDVPDIDLDD